MRKFMAIVLVVVLVFSMATVAFADSGVSSPEKDNTKPPVTCFKTDCGGRGFLKKLFLGGRRVEKNTVSHIPVDNPDCRPDSKRLLYLLHLSVLSRPQL